MFRKTLLAITVAFAHLFFNIFGMTIFYPLKAIPIGLAQFVGEHGSRSKARLLAFVAGYLCLYLVPLLFLVFT